MKRKVLYVLGLISAGAFALGAVANGPYYAFPAWSQKLACAINNCPRFIELADWNNEAVLDRETGLVWEKSPSVSDFDWSGAQFHCNALQVGNRLGWRLPTIQELASLVDPSVPFPGPALAAGHPFSGVQSSTYWSATTHVVELGADGGWNVHFFDGTVGTVVKFVDAFVWCVRGGHGVDPQ